MRRRIDLRELGLADLPPSYASPPPTRGTSTKSGRLISVTADDDVRRRRQLDRADAPQAWLDRWEAAEQRFFEYIRPTDAFDIVVNSDP